MIITAAASICSHLLHTAVTCCADRSPPALYFITYLVLYSMCIQRLIDLDVLYLSLEGEVCAAPC